jgi:hypothetical protein
LNDCYPLLWRANLFEVSKIFEGVFDAIAKATPWRTVVSEIIVERVSVDLRIDFDHTSLH